MMSLHLYMYLALVNTYIGIRFTTNESSLGPDIIRLCMTLGEKRGLMTLLFKVNCNATAA